MQLLRENKMLNKDELFKLLISIENGVDYGHYNLSPEAAKSIVAYIRTLEATARETLSFKIHRSQQLAHALKVLSHSWALSLVLFDDNKVIDGIEQLKVAGFTIITPDDLHSMLFNHTTDRLDLTNAVLVGTAKRPGSDLLAFHALKWPAIVNFLLHEKYWYNPDSGTFYVARSHSGPMGNWVAREDIIRIQAR